MIDSDISEPPQLPRQFPGIPRSSAELFTIPLESNRYIVYAPLRLAAFVANAATVNLLADLSEGRPFAYGDHEELFDFLRGLGMVDADPETLPVMEATGSPYPTAVTLLLTTACNLRCTYCYASAGEAPSKHMPFEVAQRGIDFVIANARALGEPGIHVSYHGGGEPTMNWNVLTRSLIYARQQGGAYGLTVHASLATNGVLSGKQICWIVKHVDDASLSFDGLPEVHDRHRVTAKGQGSSAHVIRCLRRFDETVFPYGIRVTVTAGDIESLPESIEFICREFKPRRIQVEPVYQLGRWQAGPSAETQQFISAFREAQALVRPLGQEIYFSGARLGLLTNHFCRASLDAFALSANGNVSACFEAYDETAPYADMFYYGRPADEDPVTGYVFDMPVLTRLRGQGVQNREFCRGCFAKWSCGGDCYYKALAASGGKPFAGTERCHIIRELTKDQILRRIADAGGLFWQEQSAVHGSTSIQEMGHGEEGVA